MTKLLDFWAEWCPPCKQMNPVIEDLEKKYTIDKIDIDKDPETTQKYGVMSIPTYIVEKDGKEIKRFTGVTPKSVLEEAMG